jgi:DNA replication protein DnaC
MGIEKTTQQALAQMEKAIANAPPRDPGEHDRQRYIELMDKTCVPKRHRNAKPNQDEQFGEKLEKLKEAFRNGYLVVLCGPRGTGKTQLAVEVIKHTSAKFYSSRFVSFFRYCQHMKECFDNRSMRESEVMTEYVRPTTLVIDEVGKVSGTEWSQSVLFNLVDRRYNALKDTILITNHTEADLSKEIGASVMRRAAETGGAIDTTEWKERYL